MSPAANAMRHAYIQHAIYNMQRTTIRFGLEGFLVRAAGNIFDSEEMVEVVTTNLPTSSFVLVFVSCSCVRAYVVLNTCFCVACEFHVRWTRSRSSYSSTCAASCAQQPRSTLQSTLGVPAELTAAQTR